ncbi:dethiobiotin synthase [Cytophagaceae bacterium DM2B3-1]|uniref:ATP-dependent dethiobiotin synthetase BioD n=1 Tax=Xanthocytophaga flava TaxID=3048013 RepID=A0ABT7CDI9_9BACT|nr:dethiobiotin synthase [Xanthocytophaga flavus]MDJ1491733.1 dethiobiotin synthase [Xanthocytophaga flavus]
MHPSKLYFITAIGTDSGKTLISAIVTEALQADYWKPIQAGFPRDTEKVQALISNSVSQFHSEAYLLQHPMSPHAAAQREGVEIDIHTLSLPNTHNTLIIEGAGGVLVPVSNQHFVIDIAQKFEAEVILVANIYLGSINHTLLTINELKRRNIPVKGIIFNGPANEDSEQFILNYSQYPLLLHVYPEEQITPEVVLSYAQQLKNSFIV